MMECKCHKGQEPLSSKQAVVMLLKSMSARPTSEQVQSLIDFMNKNEVRDYLDRSCLFVNTMMKYCEGKSISDIVNDEELYENIHQYYWKSNEDIDEDVKRAFEELEEIRERNKGKNTR